VRRMVVFLATLIAAWLGVVEPSIATPGPAAAIQVTHTYDVHPRSTAVTGSIAERGPPAASKKFVVVGAVDRGSQGASARSPLTRTVAAATDYDHLTRPVQINTRCAKTGLATDAVDGVLSHSAHLGAAAESVAANAGMPLIKAGSAGGESAGKVFPQAVKDAARAENPGTCVFCRMETKGQVDHAIPRARGGNATLDNAQIACPWCNASKGARDFPVNPPPGFRGDWPPVWWGLP